MFHHSKIFSSINTELLMIAADKYHRLIDRRLIVLRNYGIHNAVIQCFSACGMTEIIAQQCIEPALTGTRCLQRFIQIMDV